MKRTYYCIILVFCVLLLSGCFYYSTNGGNSTSTAKVTQNDELAQYGKQFVKIVNGDFVGDYNGKPAICITFEFKNESEKPHYLFESFDITAYQNDEELSFISLLDMDELTNNITVSVKNGKSIICQMYFELNSPEDEVEVQVRTPTAAGKLLAEKTFDFPIQMYSDEYLTICYTGINSDGIWFKAFNKTNEPIKIRFESLSFDGISYDLSKCSLDYGYSDIDPNDYGIFIQSLNTYYNDTANTLTGTFTYVFSNSDDQTEYTGTLTEIDVSDETLPITTDVTENTEYTQEKTRITPVTGIEVVTTKIPNGSIDNFEYTISGDKVVLERTLHNSDIIEIQACYDIDGKRYTTDMSGLVMDYNADTVIFGEGITKIDTAFFNSSGVKSVFFPESMEVVYDYSLAYLHPDDGEKIRIYYAGTQENWSKIFKNYDLTESNSDKSTSEQLGYDIAYALNGMIGMKYDSSLFEYYFSATPDDIE